MIHKTTKRYILNKHLSYSILGFILGTFGISPLVKDTAASLLGMHDYLVFSLVIGCVCLIMLPLLADSMPSSKR